MILFCTIEKVATLKMSEESRHGNTDHKNRGQRKSYIAICKESEGAYENVELLVEDIDSQSSKYNGAEAFPVSVRAHSSLGNQRYTWIETKLSDNIKNILLLQCVS